MARSSVNNSESEIDLIIQAAIAPLQAQIDNMIMPSGTSFVDTSEVAIGYLSNSDIHNNGATLSFASDVLEGGWTRSGNVFSNSSSPDAFEFFANIYAEDVGASNYWARPAMRIVDGDGTIIGQMDDLAMQQNGAYSGSVQITGFCRVNNPASSDFTFQWFDMENRTATLAPIVSSQVVLKAIKKVEVYAV